MLELRNITAGYGSHTVLRDVTLVVPDQSVVALLGANGAGKTTLLRVASGLLRPRRGRVLVDGVDLTGAPAYDLARAGLCHVPEGRGVFP
ncbi:MAG TPA: ATP-binding cassette domain-containing protein, partial [Acidimicrobiia bacterium]